MQQIGNLDLRTFEEEEKQTNFYCNTFSHHLRTHHAAISIPHRHSFFLTVLFTQGSGIHEIDFERYEIRAGSLFMLNPGQTHHWELSEDIEGVIFFHSQIFFDVQFSQQSVYNFPFFYSVHNPSALFLEADSYHKVKEQFLQLLHEFQKPDIQSAQKLASLLNCLYIDLSRLYLQGEKQLLLRVEQNSSYLRQLESLIEKNYKSEKSAAAYADQLNISMRHLNRLTQKTLNKSTTQLITERVILEARRLLVYHSSSLAEIAYQLGYEDYAYFSRLFKKWTGQTPSEFSKIYQNA